MKPELSSRIPWLAVTLLGSAYALLGWYLSAHHLLWMIGILVIAATLIVTRKGIPFLQQFSWFKSRSWFNFLVLSLILSLPVTLVAGGSAFLSLVFLPIVTMFFAEIELRSIAVQPPQLLFYLVLLAGVGLALGEAIDVVFVPSVRL